MQKAGATTPSSVAPIVEDIGSRVLYRDALMLVIDKPAGLPVHPGPKGGETLSAHLDALRFGLPRRPEAAHRLDRDTSGCLALGRHARALAQLNALFREGRVEKRYLAVVEGAPDAEDGEIALPLARRSPDPRSWWMTVAPHGDPALTHWRVLARAVDAALVELSPRTGRTHQLRVHCAAMGWPIRGDTVYGTAPRHGGPGLHLHARSLAVPLNPKRPPVQVEAPVPPLFRATLAVLGLALPSESRAPCG
jgi:tRNA pseudouridine32 synthase / 23S rRNA pseudouridine746 synthase